jgi:hypothetical protein
MITVGKNIFSPIYKQDNQNKYSNLLLLLNIATKESED